MSLVSAFPSSLGKAGLVTTRVRVRAPVRVLDAGGWTDTWFAGYGAVCNMAVSGGAEVSVVVPSLVRGGEAVVDLRVRSFGERYRFPLHAPPNRHPLLEAALSRWCPPGVSMKVEIALSVPHGSGLGTSASVVVGLVAALRTVAGQVTDAEELAAEAHRIETEDVGLQSGIQDQVAAAYGGANLVVVGPYPTAEVRSLQLSDEIWDALGRRLVTVYLGAPHQSSTVHEEVIARLARSSRDALLRPLRSAAHSAALALVAGDIDAYGEAMIHNTEAQALLHPGLVGNRARAVIKRASAFGAAGWKVNGAGGEGGSVTIVCPADPASLLAELDSMTGITRLHLEPSHDGAKVIDNG
jgi:D-glycero-alpha-D-manno-heptose-7-phosphate kinase